MTVYRDIYCVLPSRVHEVWQRTQAAEENNAEDRSVTAMLMAAAAGLAMPFENLKDVGIGNGEKWKDHPAFQASDQLKYKKTLTACDLFLKQSIGACPGFEQTVLLHCRELKDIRDAAESGQGDALLNVDKHNVRFALKILRNALAHNNIFGIRDGQGQIQKLTFFSQSNWCSNCNRTGGWDVLAIPVASFQTFLSKWFELLKNPETYIAATEALLPTKSTRRNAKQ